MSQTIEVEVVYCSDTVHQRTIQLPAGSRIADVLAQPGLLEAFGVNDNPQLRVGIYGKTCSRDQRLQPHDRVEIYRPLLLSPTEARRLRAQTLAEK